MAQPNIQTRLCPHCANSITSDTLVCPYCKADFLQSAEPEWPQRDEDLERPTSPVERKRLTVRSKAILVLGSIVFALGAYLVGGNRERSDLGPVMEEQQRTLAEKDAKIKTLERELADLRQEHQGSTSEIADLKTKLEESGNDLAAARNKLNEANHELDRLATIRSASAQATASRAEPAPPAPAGATSRTRGVEPGTYETMRAASVYEGPASSSRVVTQIAKGTQITVVRAIGGWLEIRSKHGNPPGFVRSDDVALISRSGSRDP
jgi:Bacterial SH3 domain